MRAQIRTLQRREWLVLGWLAALALLALIVIVGLRALSGPALPLTRLNVGSPVDFPSGAVTAVELAADFTPPVAPITNVAPADPGRLPLLVAHEAGNFVAFYGRDPHSGCRLLWVAADERFNDPCHGASYSRAGQYRNGPTSRNLDRFPLTVGADGQLQLDLAQFQPGASTR